MHYKFYIDSNVTKRIYDLMEDGNSKFVETDSDDYSIQGIEHGGNFCYNLNENAKTCHLYGLNEAPLMQDTTNLNSGDFPFTFHTHPIVINIDLQIIDNYPNLISAGDLFGSIIDSYYYNFSEYREICNQPPFVNTKGVNFFDIVAVPYGLFVYRPHKNMPFLSENHAKAYCDKLFDKTINTFTNYTLKNYNLYFNANTQKAQQRIEKYLNQLRVSFDVDFFTWENAKNNGIQFIIDLPDDKYYDYISCNC